MGFEEGGKGGGREVKERVAGLGLCIHGMNLRFGFSGPRVMCAILCGAWLNK